MPKLYRAAKGNEDRCKKLHMDMCMNAGPTRLEPNLFLVVDTDDLQKQVNRLENEVHQMERRQARRKWRRSCAP